eukprot:GHVR01098982.1.p1 GENE.GHVR01098982.1~~GHVR01098982.1.p1  ORF type:complete len:146 (+),score=51.15 GHVR01098982.1:24-440(+)
MCLIAVDEVHCVSEWGSSFREDYRNLNYLKKHFYNCPILALTASATPNVVDDVCTSLCLNNPNIFRCSIDRPNIFIEVREKGSTFVEAVEQIASIINGLELIIHTHTHPHTHTHTHTYIHRRKNLLLFIVYLLKNVLL